MIRAARERPAALFDGSWKGDTAGGDGGPPVLAVGSSLAMPRGPRPRAAPVPDRPQPPARGAARRRSSWTSSTSTIRSRPARPRSRCAIRARSTSAASTSRPSASSRPRWRGRWSRSSSAGSTRARRAARTTAELMERFFPGTYELVTPGADREVEGWWPGPGCRHAHEADPSGPCGSPSASRRSAARCGSSCGRCAACPWSSTGRRRSGCRTRDEVRVARRLRDRVHSVGPRRDVARGARSRAPTSSASPPAGPRRLRGWFAARSRPERSRSPRACPSTRS